MCTESQTFLFTDIEGSTLLLRHLGEHAYSQLLQEHHELIRSALSAHSGLEAGTQGDGFFAVFGSARACIAAVVEMQRGLEGHEWPPDGRIRVRMGVHAGEASDTSAGLVGLDVNRAARVAAVAHGGQVLLSEAAATLVRDRLPADVVLRDLGSHRLKDLGRPEQIFQLCVKDLQVEFPPLRSLGNPALRNNLPVELSPFIGRERELADVRALLESSRLVTLTGAGGSGKTRLSVQVAAELLDGFGDGVWVVELAAIVDPELVPLSVAEALGIPSSPGRSVLDSLRDALGHQDTLMVLDNCEHLLGACAKLADVVLRACPKVRILATSREPLGISGETIYRVPSLSLPGTDDVDQSPSERFDAVTLFVDRAKAQGLDLPIDKETFPLLVSVCRRLDGMPLAIELAAARLRSLSLSDLSDRLDQRFRLLTGGSRTALARQQTLRATVDWSYSLLNDPERALLRRLSVFAEGFDLDAAERVGAFSDVGGPSDMDEFDVTELLGSLVDKNLVVAEPTRDRLRYRLLETIRQFAAETLIDTDEAEARGATAAHCTYFLSVAEEASLHLAGPDQAKWLSRLDTEQANLRRALEHGIDDPAMTELVLRFAVALRRWWFSRRYQQDLFASLAAVLDRPDARRDPELFARALQATALLAVVANAANRVEVCERAVTAARLSHDDTLLVEALAILATSYNAASQPVKGLVAAEEALALARSQSDDYLMALSLVAYLLCSRDPDPGRSERLFDEAIACSERSGDRLMNEILHNNAGVHHLRHGNLTAARSHLERALEEHLGIGSTSQIALVNLGWIARHEGDITNAQSLLEQSFRISRRKGDRENLAYATLGLACLAGDRGEWPRASVLHGIAQALLTPSHEEWQIPESDYRQLSIEEATAHLGDQEFQHLYDNGFTRSFDDSVDYALNATEAR